MYKNKSSTETTANNKIAIDTLNDIYKYCVEQLKYSETKNGIILSVYIALFVLLGRTINIQPSVELIDKILFSTFFIFLSFGIFLSIRPFYPNTNNNESMKESPDTSLINIYFFGSISKLKSDTYLDIVLEKIHIHRNKISNEEQLQDISNQIVKISEITSFKHACFTESIQYSSFFLAIMFIYVNCKIWV